MVLKPTRLDPASASVEEIVVARLTDPAIDTAVSLPQSGTNSSRPAHGQSRDVLATGDAQFITMAESQAPSELARLAREIQAVADRIDHVETQLQHSPTLRAASSAQIEQMVRQTAHDVLHNTTNSHLDRFVPSVNSKSCLTDTKQQTFKISGRTRGAAAVAAGGGGRQERRRVRVNAKVGADVNHSVRELSSTLRRLDRVFYEVVSHEKQRHMAATRINALVRGFLTRVHYKQMLQALRQWRHRQCARTLHFVQQFCARQEFLKSKIQLLELDRCRRLLHQVITELRDITLLQLPLRLKRQSECTRRFENKQRALLKTIWTAWKSMAFGKQSRKQMQNASKMRHAAAKKRLEEMDRFQVITSEMVHEEVLKENIRVVRNAHTSHLMRMVFHLLVQEVLAPLKHKEAMADAHYRRKLLVKTRNGWLVFHMIIQRERRLATRETPEDAIDRRTLTHFEQPQNLKKIDNFHRLHCLSQHLRGWHRYVQRIRRVRRLFESNTKGNLQRLLRKWHVQAMYQRKLRIHAVNEWTSYCRRIFQTPFRAWYVMAANKRSARRARESICYAYQRRQRRQIKYAFFRLWKHQILFGNVDGLHTKIHLLRALEDQKRFCLGLEENAKLYQGSISALENAVQTIEKKLMEKQDELKKLHEATQATRFSLHQAEQTIVRTQGMLEAVRLVHPKTVDRIERVYQDNPLLTTDLQEVIQLQVTKRQALVEQIAQDSKALELECMVPGHGEGLHREDQQLLYRVKWVLSRIDLCLGSQVNNQQEQVLSVHEPQRMEGVMTMNQQLCGLFEFLRSGDVAKLSLENNPLRTSQEPAKALPVATATATAASPTANQPVNPKAVMKMLSSCPDDDAVVTRMDFVDANPRWSSFMEALTMKFALDNQLSVKERLFKHHSNLFNEIQELKDNRALHNAYSAHVTRTEGDQESR